MLQRLLSSAPLKRHLAETGPCVTSRATGGTESWNRAGLDEASQNPNNPLRLNISPIRNWRALEGSGFSPLVARNPITATLCDRGSRRLGCYLCQTCSRPSGKGSARPTPARGAVGGVSRPVQRRRASPRSSRTGDSGGGRRFRRRWPSSAGRTTSPSRTRAGSRRTGPRHRPHGGRRRRPRQPSRHPRQPPPALHRGRTSPSSATRSTSRFGRDEALARAGCWRPASEFERSYRANVGRGVHGSSQLASERYWLARARRSAGS